MKIVIKIVLDLDLPHGMSTESKIAQVIQDTSELVAKCGNFSKVKHTLLVTEEMETT
jgi:hypothetical protein